MKTKPRKASPVRKPPVKRYLFYALLVVAAIGLRLWFAGPKIPIPDLANATPELETAVNAAAARIDEAPSSADAWGNYGMLLAAHQFTAEAIQSYDKAHELESGDWRWPYLKAVALEHTDPAESIAALRESARLGRADDDLPALDLASALLDTRHPAEAEAALRSSIKGGDNLRGQLLMARALIQQDRFDESLKILLYLAEYHAVRKAAHELLSHVHTRLGNRREAEKARRIAETLPLDRPLPNPLRDKLARMHTSKEAYIAHVNQLRTQGQLEQAELVGHEGYAKFPELAYYSHGQTALLDGKPAEAEEGFRNALAIDANWIDALLGLGDSLAGQDKQPAAEAVFRQAIEIEPSNGGAHLRLGRCLLKQDKSESAVHAFRLAVEYLPLSTEAHQGLADALTQAGNNAKADVHRRHARKLAAQGLEVARPQAR